MKRMGFLLALEVCFCTAAVASPVFEESFDSAALRSEFFDTRWGSVTLRNGDLALEYSLRAKSPPSGMECRLPEPVDERMNRTIDLRVYGGGSPMSNSLFVAYAVGAGEGLCVSPLTGFSPNGRSGYVIRYIRHGDGTNEIKWYRKDADEFFELKSAWVPANPIVTLRQVVIHHGAGGIHRIRSTFDTGTEFTHTLVAADTTYPPGPIHRNFQIAAKGHTGTDARVFILTDSWVVTDEPAAPPAEVVGEIAEMVSEQARIPAEAGEIRRARREASVLSDSGEFHRMQGNFSEAETLHIKALEIRQKNLPPDDPDVLAGLQHLVVVYESQFKDSEAAVYQRQVLGILERTLGPNHPEVAKRLTWLAFRHHRSGRFREAESLYLRSLAIRKKALGEDHLEVSESLNNLGVLYMEAGDYAKAETHFKQALAIREKVIGPDHPRTKVILNNLDTLYKKMGRPSRRPRVDDVEAGK